MTVQEWHSDGTKWVLFGQWAEVTQLDLPTLVRAWLKRGVKLTVLDNNGRLLKEYQFK